MTGQVRTKSPAKLTVLTNAIDRCGGTVSAGVCLFVCMSVFPRDISTTDAAIGSPNLTQKCCTMSLGNPFILGSKGQRSRPRVTKTVPAWVSHFCECWLLLHATNSRQCPVCLSDNGRVCTSLRYRLIIITQPRYHVARSHHPRSIVDE